MIVQKGWSLQERQQWLFSYLPSEAPASTNLAGFKPRLPANPPIISQLCEPLSQPATLSDTMR
jgi:hypothetical protein